jgi:hypothetical protein
VAYRSLATLPGFAGFEFDYVASPERLQEKTGEALRRWLAAAPRSLDRHGPHLLLDGKGSFDVAEHTRLLKQRDNTPVRIIE